MTDINELNATDEEREDKCLTSLPQLCYDYIQFCISCLQWQVNENLWTSKRRMWKEAIQATKLVISLQMVINKCST